MVNKKSVSLMKRHRIQAFRIIFLMFPSLLHF